MKESFWKSILNCCDLCRNPGICKISKSIDIRKITIFRNLFYPLLTLILLLPVSINTYSQTFIGFHVGGSFSIPKISNNGNIYDSKSLPSLSVGLSGDFKIKNKISWSPSISFNVLKNRIYDTVLVSGFLLHSKAEVNNLFSYLQLQPATFFYILKISSKFSLKPGLGPYLSFLIQDKKKTPVVEDYPTTVNSVYYYVSADSYKKIDYGAILHLKLNHSGGLGLSLSYQLGFPNISERSSLEFTNRAFIILLGYSLKLKNK